MPNLVTLIEWKLNPDCPVKDQPLNVLKQVPPAELEDLIRSIPEVEDVAVIGIDDAKAGELPRAYIVRKAGAKTRYRMSSHFDSNSLTQMKTRIELLWIQLQIWSRIGSK